LRYSPIVTSRLRPFLLAAALALLAQPGCAGDARTMVLQGRDGPVRVRVEIAATPSARTQGLMYRTALAEGEGMLFVFDETKDHGFWMKNTFIPLDMIFIDEGLLVAGVHANAVPQSTQTVSIGRASRYVLEVPGGWAARHGVVTGSRVELPGIATGG
jgi:uncharacterized membrane protein (UPF0127 family)